MEYNQVRDVIGDRGASILRSVCIDDSEDVSTVMRYSKYFECLITYVTTTEVYLVQCTRGHFSGNYYPKARYLLVD